MIGLLQIIAIILVVGWLVGWIGFGAALGNFIHILLVLAVVSLLIDVIRK